MAPKRAAPTGDEVVRKSSRATKAAVVDDSNSENSQDEAPAPKKKAGKKPVKKTKKAKDESEEEDDDASDFEEAAAPVKKARGPPKEKVVKVEVAKLAVGDKVEDVTLQNENGEDVLLSSLYSAGGLILFSYPKANTPGCTSQACLFVNSTFL